MRHDTEKNWCGTCIGGWLGLRALPPLMGFASAAFGRLSLPEPTSGFVYSRRGTMWGYGSQVWGKMRGSISQIYKLINNINILWVKMVGVAGFEPTTPCPPDKCANRAALHSDWRSYRCEASSAQPKGALICSLRSGFFDTRQVQQQSPSICGVARRSIRARTVVEAGLSLALGRLEQSFARARGQQ